MKEYTTADGYKIRRIGREKKLYFESDYIYFMWAGHRYRLENIPRLSYPIFYEDENGKTGYLSGYITICNTYGVLVEITENETIILYEEIERS